jgi:acyl-homoserine-lactone acylase
MLAVDDGSGEEDGEMDEIPLLWNPTGVTSYTMLGAIRTVNTGPFLNGKAEGVAGDTYFAVIEFSKPVKAEALLGYGNWSRAGSKHVDDQLTLMSKKQMRPVWRERKEIEANLDRKLF